MAYESFAQMKADLAKKPGVTNPAGLAATLGRRKYGAAKFNKAAATGHSLRGVKPVKKKKHNKAIAAFIKAPK